MGVNTRNIQSCLQKCNKLNKSHLVGQLLNLIHDAWTHVYKKIRSSITYYVDQIHYKGNVFVERGILFEYSCYFTVYWSSTFTNH